MRRSVWREKDQVQPAEQTSASRLRSANQMCVRTTSAFSCRWFDLVARIAIFVIYFWFGFLKLLNLSPATPLASALVGHTIGMPYFDVSFKALAVFECVLGLLFLIPAMTWPSTVLLVAHLVIVSSPLVLVGSVAWIHPLVPTLEGQYIIKDVAILALAVGIIAYRELSSREAAPARANSPDRMRS
jgi:uncharacterized membrane protein YphA (DoxX/SURF4 family)